MGVTEVVSLKCAREALRTFGGVMSLLIGVSFGLIGWHWSGAILARMQPVVTILESAEILVTPPDVPAQDLRIVLRSPPIHNCTRVSQQLLYRSEPDGAGGLHRHYYPLGSGLNGQGFGIQSADATAIPGMGIAGGDFIVTVSLPSRLDPGEYWLVQRSLYDCSWAWGWLSRKIPYESPAMRVVVP